MEKDTIAKQPEQVKKSSQSFNIIGLFAILAIVLLTIIYVNPIAKIASFLGEKEIEFEDSIEDLGTLYKNEGCPKHRFTSVRHLSRRPDVTLIEGFLTEAEAQVLLNLA
jgi:hypothetical protein